MLGVLFYLSIFFTVFILQIFAMRQKKTALKKILIIISFAIIFLLLGLRYGIGSDYFSYVKIFNDCSGKSLFKIFSIYGEVGTTLIFGITSRFFSDPKIVFWIYGFLTLLPLYLINKNNKFKYIAYTTLFFNLIILPFCMNVMRQGAAIMFILLAFDNVRNDKKILRVLLYTVAAFCLHTSALVMVPFLLAYAFLKKSGEKSSAMVILIISVLISLVLTTSLRKYFLDVGFSDYSYSFSTTGDSSNIIERALYQIAFVLPTLFTWLMWKTSNAKSKKYNNDIKSMLSLICSGSIFDIIGSTTIAVARISLYMSSFQIILVPIILQNISNKNTRFITKIAYIGSMSAIFIIRCAILGSYEIMPYQTWLFR